MRLVSQDSYAPSSPRMLFFFISILAFLVYVKNKTWNRMRGRPILAKLIYLIWTQVNIVKKLICMAISMSFISCKWFEASGHSPSCIILRNHTLAAVSKLRRHQNNIDNKTTMHTIKPWLQSKRNSNGKLVSSFLKASFLSTVGVIGGSFEIDGWGVEVDW